MTPTPTAVRTAEPELDTLGRELERVDSPIGPARVRFLSPSISARIAPSVARSYDVRWVSEQLDADALGIDLALDGHRPRRLPAATTVLPLGLLLPVDEPLASGEHWLFAAPISASGLVPRSALERPRSAVAQRFWIGEGPASSAAPRGIVWLRQPEGTYNGSSAQRIVFDAHVFAADGAPLDVPCTIRVQGAAAGELRLKAPFALLGLKSGDYELAGSAAGAASSSTRFTLNRELGAAKSPP